MRDLLITYSDVESGFICLSYTNVYVKEINVYVDTHSRYSTVSSWVSIDSLIFYIFEVITPEWSE